jgi:hypothetical protein
MPALYKECPKCGYARTPADTAPDDACPACGLIFAKYLKTALGGASPRARTAAHEGEDGASLPARLMALLFYVPEEVNAITVYARAALLAVIAFYGAKLAAMDVTTGEIGSSLMHYPIVPIHEFGHILFMPFGEFMHNLGGALFQVLLPLIFGGILLLKNRDPFAAAVTLWWAAVAVIDTAPYVYDAAHPQLMLLTGRTGDEGAHDFIDVLGDLGLLHRAQPIGRGAHAVGVLVMIAALAWGAYILWLQYRQRKT